MEPAGIISFVMQGEILKNVPRTGWILAGLNKGIIESVAEHSYGTTLISLLISKQLESLGIEIDIGKTLTMAVIHDISESQTSDIVVNRKPKADPAVLKAKTEMEYSALTEILQPLGAIGGDLQESWRVLQEQTSTEAKVVAAADILDMLFHAVALEQSGVSPVLLTGFFESSRGRLLTLRIQIALDLYDLLLESHRSNLSNRSVS